MSNRTKDELTGKYYSKVLRINAEQHTKWLQYLQYWKEKTIYRGTKQGGGGSQFVNLTGLFKTKKGNGRQGTVKPDAFYILRELIDEAEAKGQGLLFYVNDNVESENPDLLGRLSVTVSNPAPQGQGRSWGGSRNYAQRGNYSRGSRSYEPRENVQYASRRQEYAQPEQPREKFGSRAANNPPKDPIEEFLESGPSKT